MAPSATDLAFRRQLVGLREVVVDRVARLYGDEFDLDDIDAALARISLQIAELLEVSQEAAAAYALAYLATLTGDEPPEVASPAGTTSRGEPLIRAMGAWPVLIKAQLAQGRRGDDVRTFARYLAQRFVDNETTAAADQVLEVATRQEPKITSWEGIVSSTACGPCRVRNTGTHPLSRPMYRHGGCACTRRFIIGEPASVEETPAP